MSKVQELKQKVAKAYETVEKRRATIARHEKQLVKKRKVLTDKGYDLSNFEALRVELRGSDDSWLAYDVESKMRDIEGAIKKLKDAERIWQNWRDKLNAEIDKEDFLNSEVPQVIKDFLEEWKQLAYDWHVKRYNDYQDFKAKIEKERDDLHVELGINNRMFPSREQSKILEEKELDYRSIERRKAYMAGVVVMKMDTMREESERLAYLDNLLEREKKAKIIDLINRINAVVGVITDARNLSITGGNLNGIIVGEKASAKVETITAGGWNIQCWHYRTLVHEVK